MHKKYIQFSPRLLLHWRRHLRPPRRRLAVGLGHLGLDVGRGGGPVRIGLLLLLLHGGAGGVVAVATVGGRGGEAALLGVGEVRGLVLVRGDDGAGAARGEVHVVIQNWKKKIGF